jgi:hypothetical protein
MRSRGTTVAPLRSTRRPTEVDRGCTDRERADKRRERPVVPEHSTFRRVAVFVPFR